MQPSFVIATDFSSPADAALDVALTYQKRFNATLNVIHIVEYPGRFSGAERRELYEDHQSELAKKRLADLREKLATEGVKVETEIRIGEVSRELPLYVKEIGCDMLFIGTHGNRSSDIPFLGSVALSMVKEIEVPLVLTRLPISIREGEWVGVAPVSRDYGIRMVTDFLQNNGWGFKICLDLVHVLLPGQSDEDAQLFMERKMEEIKEAGLCNVDATIMIADSVTDALLEYMDQPQKPVDLMVLESRPHHEFGTMTLGSNLEQLILASRRPVLCLTHATTPEE